MQLGEVLRRALGLGVFGRVLAVEDEAEQLGGPAGVGPCCSASNFLPASSTSSATNALVLGEPLLALDLGALAVAGVGEEVVPLVGQHLAAVGVGLGGEDAGDLPVLVGDERLDLALALDDQPHGDALHAAGAEAPGDLPPQQRRDLVADDAVEDPPGLLGVHPVDVDRVRVLERLLDLGLGDGVEDDAAGLVVGDAQGFLQVPGDRLALAVQVGGEVDVLAASLASFFSSLTTLPRLSRTSYSGSKVLRSTPMPLLRQVADVAHRRLHDVVVAEVLVDRLGLGGRLDDHEVFAVVLGHLVPGRRAAMPSH